ncbi:MAG: hypothetical protein J6A46_05215, partial [Clostridia bacterium]|nr:hypothetical protein [Clostridia bacterium]
LNKKLPNEKMNKKTNKKRADLFYRRKKESQEKHLFKTATNQISIRKAIYYHSALQAKKSRRTRFNLARLLFLFIV